jgi:hypothetical protein
MLAAGRVQELLQLHQIRQLDQRFLKDLFLGFHWKSVTSSHLQQLYVYISAIESESGQTQFFLSSFAAAAIILHPTIILSKQPK